MSVPATISHAVQRTQVWLKSLCDSGGYAGESEALAVLRAVLHHAICGEFHRQQRLELGDAGLPQRLQGSQMGLAGWSASGSATSSVSVISGYGGHPRRARCGQFGRSALAYGRLYA